MMCVGRATTWPFMTVAVACAVIAGCRGEEKCAGEIAGANGETVDTCKLQDATIYNLVLQAEDIESRVVRVGTGSDEDFSDQDLPDEELFDDWDARVEVRIVEPDGDERTYEGGTDSTSSVYQSEGLSGKTVSIGIDRYIPGETGKHELVVESAEFGPGAPRDALEVAIRTD